MPSPLSINAPSVRAALVALVLAAGGTTTARADVDVRELVHQLEQPGAAAGQRAEGVRRLLEQSLASGDSWKAARQQGALRALAEAGTSVRSSALDAQRDVLVKSFDTPGEAKYYRGAQVADLAAVLRLVRAEEEDRVRIATLIVEDRGGPTECNAIETAGLMAMTRYANSARALRVSLSAHGATLVESLSRTVLADAPDAVQVRELIALAEGVSGELQGADQQRVRRVLSELPRAGAGFYASVRPVEVSALSWAMYATSVSRDDQDVVMRRWCEAHPKAALELDTKGTLSLLYAMQDRGVTDQLERTLARSAMERLLSEKSLDAVEGSSARGDVIELAGRVGAMLESGERQALRRGVFDRYVYKGEALERLRSSEVRELLRAARRLDVPDVEVAMLAARWWETSSSAKHARPRELQEMIASLKRTVDMRAASVKQSICDALCAKYLCQEAYLESASAGEIADVVRIVGLALSMEQRRECARVYARVLLERGEGAPAPSILELGTLAKIIHNAELDTEGSDHAAYVAALRAQLEAGARIEGTGHHYWEAKFLSTPLSTPAARASMVGVIDRADGSVDLDAGRIAAFAYMRVNKSDDWRSLADAQLANGALTGDQRASWMLLRAYIDEIATVEWGPLQGRKHIESALAAAETEAMRRECRAWMMWRLAEAKAHEERARVARAYADAEAEPSWRARWVREAERAVAMAEQHAALERRGAPREAREALLRDRLAEIEAHLARVQGNDERKAVRQLLESVADALRGAL